eukprot:171145_1
MTACPKHATFILNIVWGLSSFIIAMCMIYYTTMHIKHICKSSAEKRPPKLLLIAGMIFNICVLFTMLTYVAVSIVWANSCNLQGQSFVRISLLPLYGFQYYFLWLVLLLRIYYVFKNTTFAASKCTICIFITIFCSLAICVLILPAGHGILDIGETGWVILIVVLMGLSIIISLAITVLFIYKLHIVSETVKHDRKGNDIFGALIIKNTILALVSMSSFFINMVLFFVIPTFDMTSSLAYIRHFMFLLDSTTNFSCVTLSYQCFEKDYNIFCGWLDRKCTGCCFKQTKDEIQLTKTSHLSIEHIAAGKSESTSM